MSTRSIKTAFGVALFSMLPFLALAQDEPRTCRIHFDDLNLNTNAGTEALYRRIDGAAQVVCQDLEGRELERRRQHDHCQANAISDAVARIHHPHLTAYYSARNGGKAPVITSQTDPLAGRLEVKR